MRSQQRGAALITVIVMVTVVLSVLTSIFHQHGVNIAKSTRMLHSEQATLLALSGESWAIDILKQDFREDTGNTKTDTLQDIWAYGLPLLPVEGGSLQGSLLDLQSLYNINNFQGYTDAMITASRSALANNQNTDILILQRLSQAADALLNGNEIPAIVDWLDNDNNALPGGAEENDYLLEEPPYRPANAMLTEIDELTLVANIEDAWFANIQPFLVALPANTAINVNTAPTEVLQSLHPLIDEYVAAELIELRNENPWETLQGFGDDLDALLSSINPGDALKQITTLPPGFTGGTFNPISVNTNYFLLNIAVQLGSNIIELKSLIRRTSDANVVVLARTLRYVPNTLVTETSNDE